MAEADATLAVTHHDQRGETEALAALHRLRHAVDVHQLFDQFLAAVVVTATATATIITTSTAAATIAVVAAAGATTTAAAATAATRRTTVIAGLLFRRRGGRCCCDRSRSGFDVGFGVVCIWHGLELQTASAGGFGQRLDATMEDEATAIEHDGGDASGLGLFGDVGAHLGGGVDIGADLALEQRR